jgi:peptide/nickel transport system substrate-binding protein
MTSAHRTIDVAIITILCSATALLVSCGEEPVTSDREASQSAPVVSGEPKSGGSLIIAVPSDADRLDPHIVTDAASMHMIENLHATLLRYGDDYGVLENDLAESVDISDDGLSVTIRLRDDAVFHSGRPVEAADVVYSINRIIDTGVRAQHFSAIDQIKTPDDHTIVLHLGHPSAPLRAYLAYPMNAIVDQQWIEAGETNSNQFANAGCGPFVLQQWRRDQSFTVVRFDEYHVPDRPYLDEIIYRPMPDETARSTAMRNGEIDIMLEVPAKDIPLLEQADDVVIESVPGTFWEYVGLNCQQPPFDDVRVRQAVAWAIDRQMINQLVKFGRATVMTSGPIPPHHWAGAEVDLYQQSDRERAGALLAEAGLSNGVDVVMKVGSDFEYQVQAAQVVKQQLAPIGIRVSLENLESSVFFDALSRGDFQMTLVGWLGEVDPDGFTWNIFHSEGKYNQQGYANNEVDRLLLAGRRTLERPARRDYYTEAQRLITADAPMAFLYVNEQVSAWGPQVQGFIVHPTATTLSLRDTWLTR